MSQPTPDESIASAEQSIDIEAAEATVFRPPVTPPLTPTDGQTQVATTADFDPLEHMVLKHRSGKRRAPAAEPQDRGSLTDTPASIDQPGSRWDARVVEPREVPAFNPLEGAAANLLALVPQLRCSIQGPDSGSLRTRLVAGLDEFDARAKRAGYDATTRSSAGYVLCALLDEAVLSTPWGSASGWDRQGLLQIRHRSRRGAQGFFELLQAALQNPGANIDLLELIYLCLCFGFFGQTSTERGNESVHARTRDALYRTIKAQRGGTNPSPALSVHWQGDEKKAVPLWRRIPPWGMAGAGVALVGGLFMVLSFLLHHDLDRAVVMFDGAVRALEPKSSAPRTTWPPSTSGVAGASATGGGSIPSPP